MRIRNQNKLFTLVVRIGIGIGMSYIAIDMFTFS